MATIDEESDKESKALKIFLMIKSDKLLGIYKELAITIPIKEKDQILR